VKRREGKGCWRGGGRGNWAAVHLGNREEEGGKERFWAFGLKIERESLSFFSVSLFF